MHRVCVCVRELAFIRGKLSENHLKLSCTRNLHTELSPYFKKREKFPIHSNRTVKLHHCHRIKRERKKHKQRKTSVFI